MASLQGLMQAIEVGRARREQEKAKEESERLNIPGAIAGVVGALLTGGGAIPALLGGVAGATGGQGAQGVAQGLTSGITRGQASAGQQALQTVLDASGLGDTQKALAAQFPETYAKSLFPDPLTAAWMAKLGIDPTKAAGSDGGGVANTTQAPAVQKIRVTSPEGKTGLIPVEDMEEAIQEGYQLDVSGSALDRGFLSNNRSKFGFGG